MSAFDIFDLFTVNFWNTVKETIGFIMPIFSIVIWFVLAFILAKFLFTFLHNWWLDEAQDKYYEKEFNWTFLELKFPRNNEIFPKAMENVFAAFYQIYSFGIMPEKRYLAGQFEDSACLEMVSSKEGIRFFIRVNKKFRTLFEKAIFSQYPETEIVEAPDYLSDFPADIPNSEYDVMGTDMILGKDSAYPLKTYSYFFGERKFEEYEIDPISHLSEVMSGLKSTEERMCVQIVISPSAGDLKDAVKKITKKILKDKKEEEKKKGVLGTITSSSAEFGKNLVMAPMQHPEWEVAAKPEVKKEEQLNAVDMEVLKNVDRKASKSAFKTAIRMIYIDKKNSFDKSNFPAMMSSFQQFNTQHLNFLRPGPTFTKPGRFFKKKEVLNRRKHTIYKYYKARTIYPYSNVEDMFDNMRVSFMNLFKINFLEVKYKKNLPEPFILNVEELATIFHPPVTRKSQAAGLAPVETKKAPPPVNLPIE